MPLYTAGDLEPTRISTWRLTFNEQSWLLDAVQYALGTLSVSENWLPEGDVNQDDAAGFGIECIETFFPAVDMIGTIVPFGGTVPPDGALICDGASYLRTDYLDLFGVIGTLYGADDISHFNVPDLRGRVAVGDGTGPGLTNRPIASTFGEEAHALSSGENATHNHGVFTTNGLAVAPGELPVKVPSLVTSDASADQGAGDAHNNMQPSLALSYIIIAVHG